MSKALIKFVLILTLIYSLSAAKALDTSSKPYYCESDSLRGKYNFTAPDNTNYYCTKVGTVWQFRNSPLSNDDDYCYLSASSITTQSQLDADRKCCEVKGYTVENSQCCLSLNVGAATGSSVKVEGEVGGGGLTNSGCAYSCSGNPTITSCGSWSYDSTNCQRNGCSYSTWWGSSSCSGTVSGCSGRSQTNCINGCSWTQSCSFTCGCSGSQYYPVTSTGKTYTFTLSSAGSYFVEIALLRTDTATNNIRVNIDGTFFDLSITGVNINTIGTVSGSANSRTLSAGTHSITFTPLGGSQKAGIDYFQVRQNVWDKCNCPTNSWVQTNTTVIQGGSFACCNLNNPAGNSFYGVYLPNGKPTVLCANGVLNYCDESNHGSRTVNVNGQNWYCVRSSFLVGGTTFYTKYFFDTNPYYDKRHVINYVYNDGYCYTAGAYDQDLDCCANAGYQWSVKEGQGCCNAANDNYYARSDTGNLYIGYSIDEGFECRGGVALKVDQDPTTCNRIMDGSWAYYGAGVGVVGFSRPNTVVFGSGRPADIPNPNYYVPSRNTTTNLCCGRKDDYTVFKNAQGAANYSEVTYTCRNGTVISGCQNNNDCLQTSLTYGSYSSVLCDCQYNAGSYAIVKYTCNTATNTCDKTRVACFKSTERSCSGTSTNPSASNCKAECCADTDCVQYYTGASSDYSCVDSNFHPSSNTYSYIPNSDIKSKSLISAGWGYYNYIKNRKCIDGRCQYQVGPPTKGVCGVECLGNTECGVTPGIGSFTGECTTSCTDAKGTNCLLPADGTADPYCDLNVKYCKIKVTKLKSKTCDYGETCVMDSCDCGQGACWNQYDCTFDQNANQCYYSGYAWCCGNHNECGCGTCWHDVYRCNSILCGTHGCGFLCLACNSCTYSVYESSCNSCGSAWCCGNHDDCGSQCQYCWGCKDYLCDWSCSYRGGRAGEKSGGCDFIHTCTRDGCAQDNVECLYGAIWIFPTGCLDCGCMPTDTSVTWPTGTCNQINGVAYCYGPNTNLGGSWGLKNKYECSSSYDYDTRCVNSGGQGAGCVIRIDLNIP